MKKTRRLKNDMPDRKLILPAELQVCATCAYWDGIRSVDREVRVVVVSESCEGECLVREVPIPALRAVHQDSDCLWDDLQADKPPADEGQAEKRES
jgi:hypothetical protein